MSSRHPAPSSLTSECPLLLTKTGLPSHVIVTFRIELHKMQRGSSRLRAITTVDTLRSTEKETLEDPYDPPHAPRAHTAQASCFNNIAGHCNLDSLVFCVFRFGRCHSPQDSVTCIYLATLTYCKQHQGSWVRPGIFPHRDDFTAVDMARPACRGLRKT